MSGSWVYLIEAENSLVKVGYGFPAVRLATVRTHSPLMVRLIAQWPGGLAEEQDIHAKYLRYRNHSEWFRLEGDFLRFVEEVRGTGVTHIEPWSDLLFSSRATRRAKRSLKAKESMKAYWADPQWKLHHLGQLLASRMEKKEFGSLSVSGRTSSGHRRAHEIREEAHRIVRASLVGQALLARIDAALSEGVVA